MLQILNRGVSCFNDFRKRSVSIHFNALAQKSQSFRFIFFCCTVRSLLDYSPVSFHSENVWLPYLLIASFCFWMKSTIMKIWVSYCHIWNLAFYLCRTQGLTSHKLSSVGTAPTRGPSWVGSVLVDADGLSPRIVYIQSDSGLNPLTLIVLDPLGLVYFQL